MEKTLQERFWEKTQVASDNNCINWTGAKTKQKLGYGVIRVTTNNKVLSHHLAWQWKYGEIPQGMLILHSCDNSLCVNAEHLYLGTQKDNIRDMIQRKRDNRANNLKGEHHPKAKLTQKSVIEILESNKTQAVLAKIYQVKQSVISNIRCNKSWKIIKREKITIKRERSHSKVTTQQVLQILADTRSIKDIGKDYNIKRSQISNIKNGFCWKSCYNLFHETGEI